MNSQATVRTAVLAMTVLIITAMLTGKALAQEESNSTWSGNRIREISMNWADFVNEDAATDGPLQAWAGPMIHEASTNWADYAGGSVAASVNHPWSGPQVQQASMNWADNAHEAAATEALRQAWAGPMIDEASTNWADHFSEPVVASQQK
jgi:hypothetical protein